MSLIAERVGVRKASLYNYYTSKAELLLDLLESSMAGWEQACRPALQGPGSSEGRLAAYLQAVVSFARENPQALGILRLAAGQIGGALGRQVRALMATHEQKSRAILTEFFAGALEQGEIDRGPPEELALFWSTFIDGVLIHQLFATAKASDLVDHLPRLWVLFWRGVSGHDPRTELGS
jgi:AcrR family transcriptional regulator